jgi:hypothetical protein
MPNPSLNAENSREFDVPDCLRLLSGCLVLSLILVIPIVAYTDHIKRSEGVFVQAPSQVPSAEEMVAVKIAGPVEPQKVDPRNQVQTRNISLEARQSRSSQAAANRKSAPDRRSGAGLAARKPVVHKLISRKLIRTPAGPNRNTSRFFARNWLRNNTPRGVVAALIGAQHRNSRTASKRQKSGRLRLLEFESLANRRD